MSRHNKHKLPPSHVSRFASSIRTNPPTPVRLLFSSCIFYLKSERLSTVQRHDHEPTNMVFTTSQGRCGKDRYRAEYNIHNSRASRKWSPTSSPKLFCRERCPYACQSCRHVVLATSHQLMSVNIKSKISDITPLGSGEWRSSAARLTSVSSPGCLEELGEAMRRH